MAEVEDVAGPAGGAPQDAPHRGLERLGWRQQGDGIEVALHADVLADGAPARVEVHAPVETDHVAARLAQERQQPRGAGTEVDDRRAGRERRDHRARVRQHERAVVVGREGTDP